MQAQKDPKCDPHAPCSNAAPTRTAIWSFVSMKLWCPNMSNLHSPLELSSCQVAQTCWKNEGVGNSPRAMLDKDIGKVVLEWVTMAKTWETSGVEITCYLSFFRSWRNSSGARWLHCIWWHTISCSTRWSIGNSCNWQQTAQVRMIKKICQIQKSWFYLMHNPPCTKTTRTTKGKLKHASFGCTKQNQAWVSHKHVCAFLTNRWSTCTGIPSRCGFPYGFSTDSWAPSISRIRFWKEAINSYKPWRHGSYRISPWWKWLLRY